MNNTNYNCLMNFMCKYLIDNHRLALEGNILTKEAYNDIYLLFNVQCCPKRLQRIELHFLYSMTIGI